MSDNHQSMPRWHDAAALASFPIYEAGSGSERWAGGFSSDGDHIEVIALVDGDEVSVECSRAEDTARESIRRRLAITELLWHHVLASDGELALPYTVTIEGDDRSVSVDGEVRAASGMRVAGHPRWIGSMRVGDVMVKITTASPAALSLRVCDDWSSLPEFPPGPH